MFLTGLAALALAGTAAITGHEGTAAVLAAAGGWLIFAPVRDRLWRL
jgi:hypothetical protein